MEALLTVKACTELQMQLVLCAGLACYHANTPPKAQIAARLPAGWSAPGPLGAGEQRGM